MEDGETYPVRYYFPGYKREGVKKELDISRAGEINPQVAQEASPEVVEETDSVIVERLPGGFESKGMSVHRIIFAKEAELDVSAVGSFHSIVTVKGKAKISAKGKSYTIPMASAGGEMMIIPASAGEYKIIAEEPDTQLIDTFTPIK
jgi:hypothetical protein